LSLTGLAVVARLDRRARLFPCIGATASGATCRRKLPEPACAGVHPRDEMKIEVEIKELNVDLRGLVQLLLVLLYIH
jgi:hypothetical protein